jgi:hypothetical protein
MLTLSLLATAHMAGFHESFPDHAIMKAGLCISARSGCGPTSNFGCGGPPPLFG